MTTIRRYYFEFEKLLQSKEYRRRNQWTYHAFKILNEYYKNQGLIFINVLAAANTINLTLQKKDTRTHTMLLLGKGSAKSTFLLNSFLSTDILLINDKMYESSFVKTPKEKIYDKIIIDQDFISTSSGSDKKQREQVFNMLTQLGSQGKYSREAGSDVFSLDIGRGAIILANAIEEYMEHHRMMQSATFNERYLPLYQNTTPEEMMEIIDHIDKMDQKGTQPPTYKELGKYAITVLKKTKTVNIGLLHKSPLQQKKAEIILDFLHFDVLSGPRTNMLIKNICRSHAMLNGRDHVTEDDFLFAKCFCSYALEAKITIGIKKQMVWRLKSMYPGKTNREIAQLLDTTEGYVNKILQGDD